MSDTARRKVSVSISMTQNDLDLYKAIADREGITLSAFIRLAMNEYLYEHQHKDKPVFSLDKR